MLTSKNSSERLPMHTKLPAVKTPGINQSLLQQSIGGDPYQQFATPQKIPVRHQLLNSISKKASD